MSQLTMNTLESSAGTLLSPPLCSPWLVLYIVTAILWATYAARMARQEYRSDGHWFWSFAVNLLLCPVAILWASIFKENVKDQASDN